MITFIIQNSLVERTEAHLNSSKTDCLPYLVDVVGALTDSTNPTDYLKKMRKRDELLASYLGTNCPQVTMVTATGKKRKTLAANTIGILRLIQSIPSPNKTL